MGLAYHSNSVVTKCTVILLCIQTISYILILIRLQHMNLIVSKINFNDFFARPPKLQPVFVAEVKNQRSSVDLPSARNYRINDFAGKWVNGRRYGEITLSPQFRKQVQAPRRMVSTTTTLRSANVHRTPSTTQTAPTFGLTNMLSNLHPMLGMVFQQDSSASPLGGIASLFLSDLSIIRPFIQPYADRLVNTVRNDRAPPSVVYFLQRIINTALNEALSDSKNLNSALGRASHALNELMGEMLVTGQTETVLATVEYGFGLLDKHIDEAGMILRPFAGYIMQQQKSFAKTSKNQEEEDNISRPSKKVFLARQVYAEADRVKNLIRKINTHLQDTSERLFGVYSATEAQHVPSQREFTSFLTTQYNAAEQFNVKFTIQNHNLCRTNANQQILLLILVASHPSSVRDRQIIRETWAKFCQTDKNTIRVGFMLGTTTPVDQQIIESEQHQHGDLIQIDIEDSYANLARKSAAMLKFFTEFCSSGIPVGELPAAKYLMKTDEDVFINVPELVKILQNGEQFSVFGYRSAQLARPDRSPVSKHYVSHKIWPLSRFPAYTTGAGYVLDGRVVPRMWSVAKHTPIVPIEDVFVTGILAEKLNLARTGYPNMYAGQYFTDIYYSVCDSKQYIVFPDLSRKERKRLYREFSQVTESDPFGGVDCEELYRRHNATHLLKSKV